MQPPRPPAPTHDAPALRDDASSPRLAMRCVALAGGVGGARLADGLYRALQPRHLSIVVNTADDFTHLGLRICPDMDTVMYTLAGLAPAQQGWGVDGDTRHAMDQLARYGAPDWFLLTDRDLATHLWRTELLRQGSSLTTATQRLAVSLGIAADVLPMCNEPVASFILTPDGRRLSFQEYFVRLRHAEPVATVELEGIGHATLPDAVRRAVEAAEAVVWCPSNPMVSLGPILAVPAMRELLRTLRVPRVAVSPIVGGRALKGPAAEMLVAMGHEASALGVARVYQGLVDALVIDHADTSLAPAIRSLGIEPHVTDTIMHTPGDRVRLARFVLDLVIRTREGGETRR